MIQRTQTFKNSNTPNSSIKRPKGRLIKIDFGAHNDEIKKIWETPTSYRSGSIKSKLAKIQKLVGYGNHIVGLCSVCHINMNTHILKQKIDNAVLITRFCSEHLPK